ncbi:NAD(P)/FAD-dependent oxidoreductase [Synechocystis sp. LKSZ1]|uniref:NAD(P)/FAD-dependent oxidoreductase n=1 Tax=Synechocystis sp. LKSZ1 TaxID=3144951 RepID=UPI00336BE071
MIYDVIVVGAGLAGSSAAIQLAQRGYQVLLLEQARYPTHRLCGEFLSVEVIEIFARLGILETVRAVGAYPIQNVYLTNNQGAEFRGELPGTALGLSRYQLDRILWERAEAVGAIAHQGTAVKAIAGSFGEGFQVSTHRGNFDGRFVLGAFGKASSLDHQLNRPFIQQKSPWIASKAHYQGQELPQGIELHAFPGGYCGLSQVEAGKINVCWIAHQRVLKNNPRDRHTPEALFQNSMLAERLQSWERVTSPKNLAQISFARKDPFEDDLCLIGDAGGMITPLCGDGMAMALRSADLVVPLISQLLQDSFPLATFKDLYERAWRQEFNQRLQLGRFMHQAFINPTLAAIGVNSCRFFPALGRWLIASTRGKAA